MVNINSLSARSNLNDRKFKVDVLAIFFTKVLYGQQIIMPDTSEATRTTVTCIHVYSKITFVIKLEQIF